MSGRIGFSIVTGFLGAGKTTLINRLLRSEGLTDALVLVNEWGAIGLDHLLYERLAGDAILVAGGCVCCALRGDLVDALRDALARRDAGALPPFGRVILETTGLAEPAPILHALAADPQLAARFAPPGVTTVVDAVNGLVTLGAHAESGRQIALADSLVVAKGDLVGEGERAALAEALRALNPVAPILDAEACGPAELVGPSGHSRFRATAAEPPHGRSLAPRTFAFRTEEPIERSAFDRFLTALGAMLGPRLLRLKGLVALADQPERPIRIDGVQHVLHPPQSLSGWPDEDRATRLVVIVEPEAARDVDRLWAALTRTPAVDSPDLAALADNPLAPRRGGLLG